MGLAAALLIALAVTLAACTPTHGIGGDAPAAHERPATPPPAPARAARRTAR
jgi:predicted small secreted protein